MEKMIMHSPNQTQENIARLRELFPSCVTEAKGGDGAVKLAVDFDQLRQELAESIVEGPQERYHLNWPGKREALLTANAPIAKTLRPCREESVDFDTTQNLFIEGDNLDALKLLQETYLGKVKMIYIDPPYNTGNDFIYEDDFSENANDYLRRSNQKDEEGNRLVANTASNGRFHSDWLTMIYPRLRLARNLLRDDGVIFISIDDEEAHNLRKVCDEIFGSENFIAQFVWKARQFTDARAKTNVSTDHEYIIAYAQNSDFSLKGIGRDESKFSNKDNDPRGDWMSRSILGLATREQRPNLHYDILEPGTGRIFPPNPSTGWRYSKERMNELAAEGRILFPKNDDGRPREKKFRKEMKSDFIAFRSIIDGIHTADGTQEIRSLFGSDLFPFPKPTALIASLINQVTDEDDIIVDFFSGSATTAQAVMQVNASDGGRRQFVLVQLPEPCNQKSEAYRVGCKNIAEISKERIRLAGKKIISSQSHDDWNKDIGFRVLKIDSSNMADVYYTPDVLDKANLDLFVENIKPDRTAEDLLFQVMLDWGVDLALPITKDMVQGKEVFLVDGNDSQMALAACFDANGGIDEAFVKALAQRQPLRMVFRDAGFNSSAVKINVEQIFKLLSPATVVKCI
ncbi:DNA methyltransferase [Aeromonas hydrophila NJ-35]|nr:MULTISPECIES: site-specific DNA-methyltransferase [Aeromonas]AKJ36919.1 DNA methyltransferase [Aeromonas hydrophila NJ-35]QGW99250.1 site-specific DNA-methyltransferase [Aeromonas veronii]HDK8695701.1 site-specific DNA-methyltransferase [Aeromonas hydrophila]